MAVRQQICLFNTCICNTANDAINCLNMEKQEEINLEILLSENKKEATEENLFIFSDIEKCAENLR